MTPEVEQALADLKRQNLNTLVFTGLLLLSVINQRTATKHLNETLVREVIVNKVEQVGEIIESTAEEIL